MGRCLGTGQFLNRDIKKVALLDSVFLFILALDEKHSREGNGRLEENKTQGGKHMKKKIALLLAATNSSISYQSSIVRLNIRSYSLARLHQIKG